MWNRQFSLLQLLVVITLIALFAAVFTLSLRLRNSTARHESERLELRGENADLSRELTDLQFRTRSNEYSTLVLLHIVNNRSDFERIHACMVAPNGREIATFFHPMDEGDNVGHVSVTVTDGNSSASKLGASFLIKQEPFEVVDYLAGNPSRIPLFRDGVWNVDNRIGNGTIRYRIKNGEFVR
jgi:hypothetical protein